jgi:hypothetical protein
MEKPKSAFKILLKGLLGIFILLVVIFIANYFVDYINSDIYSKTIHFFNNNLVFLIMISLIAVISELFFSSFFPFILFSPIISSVVGIMVTVFMFRAFKFADDLTGMNLFIYAKSIDYFVYLAVFAIVLISGYVLVFKRILEIEEDKKEQEELKAEKERIQKKKVISPSWEEIGSEYKQALLNLGKRLKTAFSPKNKR